MDLFDTKRDGFKSMKALLDSPFEKVSLNYVALSAYSRMLNSEKTHDHLRRAYREKETVQAPYSRMQPIRPPTLARAFSTNNKEESTGFFNFLKAT